MQKFIRDTMDIRKALKIAKVPIILLLVIAVVLPILLSFIPSIGLFAVFIPFLTASVLLVYAGYLISKEGFEFIESAVVGAITPLLVFLIYGLLVLIPKLLLMGDLTADRTNNLIGLESFLYGVFFSGVPDIVCFIGYAFAGILTGAAAALLGHYLFWFTKN